MGVWQMNPVRKILTTSKGARYASDSFTADVFNKMKNKGWFKVSAVVPMYAKMRGVNLNSAYSRSAPYMSGDASWRLKLMVDTGVLERKPDPKASGHYLYRVRR